ncbi:MAG: hypothetical protein U5L07_16235 [Desulfobacterales bacterium]|nr:hypothetical protein [Desulfobacterales bacterium]
MAASFLRRLMKPFLISLMLLALAGASGFPADTQEETDPSSRRFKDSRPVPDKAAQSITDVPIENGPIKQQLMSLPIHAEKTGAAIRIHPPSIDITLLGPASEPKAPDELKNAAFAYIQANGLAAGIYVRPARIILPEGYVLIDARPELFVVEIAEAEETAP